jgi:hypothetical protein
MTRDEILALPAGLELNELVAEHVLGWRRREGVVFSNESRWQPPDSVGWDWLPDYSGDIAAAWQVVEKLTGGMVQFRLERTASGRTYAKFVDCTWPACLVGGASATAAPHAICKAALLAVLESA